MKKNKSKELELSKGIKKVITKACCFSFDFNCNNKGLFRVTLDVESAHFRVWVWSKQNQLVKCFNLSDNTFTYPEDLNELVLFEKAVESLISKLNQK